MSKFNYKKWVVENKYNTNVPSPKKNKTKKPTKLVESNLRQRLNEDPSMWSAIGGIMGLLGTASIVASLEMMSEDPAMQEKYPKATDALKKIFGFLRNTGIGSSVGGWKS